MRNEREEGPKGDAGAIVRAARQAKRMSQEALAYKAGIDQSGLSKMERGQREMSRQQAEALAALLGLDVSDLWQ